MGHSSVDSCQAETACWTGRCNPQMESYLPHQVVNNSNPQPPHATKVQPTANTRQVSVAACTVTAQSCRTAPTRITAHWAKTSRPFACHPPVELSLLLLLAHLHVPQPQLQAVLGMLFPFMDRQHAGTARFHEAACTPASAPGQDQSTQVWANECKPARHRTPPPSCLGWMQLLHSFLLPAHLHVHRPELQVPRGHQMRHLSHQPTGDLI